MDGKIWSTLLENAQVDDRLRTSLQLQPSCNGNTCQNSVDVIIVNLQVHSPPHHHMWIDTFLEILLPFVTFIEGAARWKQQQPPPPSIV